MDKMPRPTAQWIIQEVSTTNPWQRTMANQKGPFYVYNMGFLASTLASILAEDPHLQRRFIRHLRELRKR